MEQNGSIPACTGEPLTPDVPGIAIEVYPRVYGGTDIFSSSTFRDSGLSPRVRGNPPGFNPHGRCKGSIPACTGEPVAADCTWTDREVYPRVYGGTFNDEIHLELGEGLSPRVRGNRNGKYDAVDNDGSIPACTGEPAGRPCSASPTGVYPRVYGGTRRQPHLRP